MPGVVRDVLGSQLLPHAGIPSRDQSRRHPGEISVGHLRSPQSHWLPSAPCVHTVSIVATRGWGGQAT